MDETRQRQETGGEDAEERDSRQQQIVDMGSATIKTEKGTIHTLTIVGQIEGHQILPPPANPQNMNMLCPCWPRWRRATRWTDCLSCSTR